MARSVLWRKLSEVMTEEMAEKIARIEARRNAMRMAELCRPLLKKGCKLTIYAYGKPWIEMEEV